MIKAVIFDCFGVIVTDAFQMLHTELQTKDPVAATQVDDLVYGSQRGYITPEDSVRQMAELFGMDEQQFRYAVDRGESKDQELIAYIKQLRKHYKTAMLSNIGVESLRKRFSDKELAELFDAVVTSGEVGYAKPEAEIYQIAADRLGVRFDECLFTDDREDFCAAARSTGMQAIRYTSVQRLKNQANLQV
jgi:epoxide hydrolase-like predicted phosphatase